MSHKPMKPCKHPGCIYITTEQYCKEHQHLYDRPVPAEGVYDIRWNMAQKKYLTNNTICVECARNGRAIEAVAIGHKQPHNRDPTLFWNEAKWQALCAGCYKRKAQMKAAENDSLTAAEMG